MIKGGWLQEWMIFMNIVFELGSDQSLKAGNYTFTIEQIMREDPLENVLNVGLRIEKKQ